MVDSTDEERLVSTESSSISFFAASSGLKFVYEEAELADSIILVLANKQDVPGALPVAEIRERLRLDVDFPGRHIHLQGCSAMTSDGMYEGLDWLHDTLRNRPPPPPPSTGTNSEPDSDEGGGTATLSPPLSPAEQEAQRLEALLLEWLERDDLAPDTFLAQVEDATLDIWDHYTHLRIAWLLLSRHGRREGMARIFTSIESFIGRSPRTKRSDTSRGTTFHETMTYFWVHMVHYAMMTMQSAASASAMFTTSATIVTTAESVLEESPQGEGEGGMVDDELRAFKHFLLMNPQLVNGGLFLHYYSKQRMLMNAEARSSVLLPDIRPLPSFLGTSAPGSFSAGGAKNTDETRNEITPAHLRLQPRAPLNDVDFLLAIKQRNFQSWGHDILTRVVYVMLMDQQKKAGTQKRNVDEIFDTLRQVQGDSFHMTLNYFWVQMISYHMESLKKKKSKTKKIDQSAPSNSVMDFETFYRQPDCQRLRNQLLYEKYYGRSVVDSQEAAESFVLPNLKQLPSVL